MKKIYFTLLSLLPLMGSSQHFVADSTLWSYSFSTWNLPGGTSFVETKQFATVGDTTINGLLYNRLYEDTTYNDVTYDHSHAKLIAFLRYDSTTQRAFARDLQGLDTLIMDFSLNVGDTLRCIPTYGEVSGIDSIHTHYGFKKRFRVDPGLALQHMQYAEGIGYLYGEGIMAGWRYYNVGIHKDFNLVCMKQGDHVIYSQTAQPCPLGFEPNPGVSVKESSEVQLKLYPNPAANFITAEFNVNGLYDLALYSPTGKLLQKFMALSTTEQQIDLSGLKPGIYLLQAHDQAGTSFTQRFVKK